MEKTVFSVRVVLFGIFAVTACLSPHGVQAAQAAEIDYPAVMRRVVSYRTVVLLEPLRWNWCLVPQAWDATGHLLGGEEVVVRAQVRNRAQCTDGLMQNVRHGGINQVHTIRHHGDSIVVTAFVKREITGFAEQYLLRKSRGGAWFVDEYRITGVQQG